MHRGYVKLWRKSLESSTWADIDLWRTWCCCLMAASHKEKNILLSKTGTTVKIKSGQFVTGRESFYRLMYPKKRKKNPHPITVWRWLEALNMMQNLHIETHNKYSIVTIINWDTYQQEDYQNEQHNVSSLHRTCTQRAPNVHTIKNDKNVKNVKNKEGNPKIARKIPADFELNESLLALAKNHGLNSDRVHDVFIRFKAYHESKGTVMLNWDKAWLTWVLRDKEFSQKNQPPQRSIKYSDPKLAAKEIYGENYESK